MISDQYINFSFHDTQAVKRSSSLERLDKKMENSSCVVIVPEEGLYCAVGKTELVKQHAYSNKDYKHVFWFEADSSEKLAQQYKELAQKFELIPKKETEEREVLAEVKKWLSLQPKCLFIFDGALDTDSIAFYLPEGKGHKILITSRSRTWPFPLLSLGLFDEAEAMDCLCESTKQYNNQSSAFLAEMLGYVPSSIRKAARCLGTMPLADYPAHLNFLLEETDRLVSNDNKRFNVPLRNKQFIGREATLVAIEEYFRRNTSQPLILLGEPGLGKTEIALQYIYRNALDQRLNFEHPEAFEQKPVKYKDIAWIEAQNTEALYESYRMLAKHLKIKCSEKEQEQENFIKEVMKQWEEKKAKRLLIFNDVENLEELFPYLPKKGDILIISNASSLRGKKVGHVIPIQPLTSNESVSLFLKATDSHDKQNAVPLAELLKSSPLAILQASAYVKASKISLKDYSELFEQERQEKNRRRIDNCPFAVQITCSLALKKILKKEEDCTKEYKDRPRLVMPLLNFLAALASADKELLEEWRKKEHSNSNERDLNQAIGLLANYKLIETKEQSETNKIYSLPPSVKAFLKNYWQ